MDDIRVVFWENADSVALYDIVLLKRNLGDGLTPGEAATMAGKMDGPFEPIEFQGEEFVAMGFGTVDIVNRLLLDASLDDLEGLEGFIVSILDEKGNDGTIRSNPGGRYKYKLSSGETIKILLRTHINDLASSVSAVLELSTLHLTPRSYEELVQMSQKKDTLLTVYTSCPDVSGGIIVNVPYEAADLFAGMKDDLAACIQAAVETDANWIEFSPLGRKDPALPTYWEEWSGEKM